LKQRSKHLAGAGGRFRKRWRAATLWSLGNDGGMSEAPAPSDLLGGRRWPPKKSRGGEVGAVCCDGLQKLAVRPTPPTWAGWTGSARRSFGDPNMASLTAGSTRGRAVPRPVQIGGAQRTPWGRYGRPSSVTGGAFSRRPAAGGGRWRAGAGIIQDGSWCLPSMRLPFPSPQQVIYIFASLGPIFYIAM
jgi:hypothetical protein